LKSDRIHLSPPHLSGAELGFVYEAFATNWVAPVGPHIEAFEREVAQYTGAGHAVAVSSGTAALHLALILADVAPGDEVFVSTFTFSASANPIVYLGARPTFIDSERESWNMSPELLEEALEQRARAGRLPKAVVLAHIYGQSANLDPIAEACNRFEVTLIEDAAEALGSTYCGRSPGTFGQIGMYSFNGNKIITTSGGGMLVTDSSEVASRARKLATQARDAAPHYEHSEIGYNYRLSNVLAGIGRAQLAALEDRVEARRTNFREYQRELSELPGIGFQPETSWGRHSRWLSCITIDPSTYGADRETVRHALEAANIESRPLWKPLHLQPVFAECEARDGRVAEDLFAQGLCLPSGSSLTSLDRERVLDVIWQVHVDRTADRSRKPELDPILVTTEGLDDYLSIPVELPAWEQNDSPGSQL
jgi:pyridoxal phosphate-dependent aminotransferase EpsN